MSDTDSTEDDVDSTPDNVAATTGRPFGGGGRIYRDSRPPEQRDPEVPPWADQPEPIRPPTPIRPSVVKTVQPEPDPEPEPEPRNWREPISTALEVLGMIGLAITGFLIALWVGVLVASICLILLGITISREPVSAKALLPRRSDPDA